MMYQTAVSSRVGSLLLVLLGGCGAVNPPPTRTAQSAADPAEVAARVQRIRSWEAPAMKKFHIDLPDGVMSADVEAMQAPKLACKNASGESRTCTIEIDLGKDEDGDPKSLECAANWSATPLPFGIMVKAALGKFGLNESPRIDVGWNPGPDGGVIARFAGNISNETDDHVLIGTAKFAARYAPGHTIFCGDASGGGEKTVTRLVNQLFESSKVKGLSEGVLMQNASKERRGDTSTGFRYEYVRKNEDGGLVEVKSAFHIATSEKTWDVRDFSASVERDSRGSIESLKEMFWTGGHAVVLSAKPGEAGRLRLKLETNGKTDALEITPQVPLSTELWESASLLRVGSGGTPSHRYAFLALSDDGEPTLSYSNLTRIRPGVIQEEVEHHGKKPKSADKTEKNELVIDERGFVKKQVSSDTVDERLHLSGSLPKSGETANKSANKIAGKKP
jgi:hypothetical protein